jgi:hypothetical protein
MLKSAPVPETLTQTLASRFWAKVQKTDGCWKWIGGTTSFGYGVVEISRNPRRRTQAHRVSWELHYGPIPDGMDVLHSCDNPPCTRPDHLFLGTALDNQQDAINKKRRPLVPDGLVTSWINQPRKLFSDDQIRQIRELYESQRHWPRNKARPYSLKGLAKLFDTSFEEIAHIVHGRVYKHVA